jgi:hypothetical protein
MISAKEVKKISETSAFPRLEKATKWAEDEMFYIEEDIEDAALKGKYKTTYWWSLDLLDEVGITQEEAKIALTAALIPLGFSLTFAFDALRIECECKSFEITIDWEDA